MHVAFVDESATRTGVYVFAAVVASSPQIKSLSHRLDDLVDQLHHKHGVETGAELHAHELFHGLGPWDAVPPRARLWAQERVINAIRDTDVKLCMRGVDGPRLKERQRRRRYPTNFSVEQEAFKHLLQRLQLFAEGHQSDVLVIADERSDRDSHRTDLAMHRLDGTPGDYWRTNFENILDTVHFAPSHHSRMLQAADHYAFFARRGIEVQHESDQRAEQAMARISQILTGKPSFGCGVWSP